MATDPVALTLPEIEDLAARALLRNRTSENNARVVARSIMLAERDGLHSHGLARLPSYCDHARIGKVDGFAVPVRSQPRPALVQVDACTGFAHPAIELGFAALIPAVRTYGTTVLGVTNSYNCGVVGHHVEALADAGLIGLAFVNTPAAIAPWSGTEALFGTNPIGFACPRADGPPIVIDQSSSVIARGEILLRSRRGEPIPEGWGLDRDGQPTRDPDAVLKGGSLLPSGGYKGAGLALLVEILAAALVGANLSYEASSFANNSGGPPRTGQTFIAIDPAPFGAEFGQRVAQLCARILGQPNVRLPGDRRLAARARNADGRIEIDRKLYSEITARIEAD